MTAHRLELVLTEDNKLNLTGLPFRAGTLVEVIILENLAPKPNVRSNPLWGTPLHYEHPFEPVAENEWEVLK